MLTGLDCAVFYVPVNTVLGYMGDGSQMLNSRQLMHFSIHNVVFQIQNILHKHKSTFAAWKCKSPTQWKTAATQVTWLTKWQRSETFCRCVSVSIATQKIRPLHCEAKKLHPCSFCNNLIKLRSSKPVFANLNVLVTKRCTNFTFADQAYFTVRNSINVSKLFNNQS